MNVTYYEQIEVYMIGLKFANDKVTIYCLEGGMKQKVHLLYRHKRIGRCGDV